jgi:hypothetical protein
MELKIDDNGIRYYSITRGTPLYRGDSSHTGEKMILDNKITFFGFDKENVEENYGITYKFITSKALKLIAVDKNKDSPFINIVDNIIDDLKKDTSDEGKKKYDKYKQIPTILNKNYGYATRIRDSDAQKDYILSEFICGYFDYDGYACDEMPTQTGHLHQEAMLCYPAKKIKGNGKRVTKSDKVKILHDKWNLLQLGREMEEQRKEARKNARSRFELDDEQGRSELFRRAHEKDGEKLFGSDDKEESGQINLFSSHLNENDDYELPDLPKGGKLFGGKRQTKRRQRKTKRRGKRKKTYKKRC